MKGFKRSSIILILSSVIAGLAYQQAAAEAVTKPPKQQAKANTIVEFVKQYITDVYNTTDITNIRNSYNTVYSQTIENFGGNHPASVLNSTAKFWDSKDDFKGIETHLRLFSSSNNLVDMRTLPDFDALQSDKIGGNPNALPLVDRPEFRRFDAVFPSDEDVQRLNRQEFAPDLQKWMTARVDFSSTIQSRMRVQAKFSQSSETVNKIEDDHVSSVRVSESDMDSVIKELSTQKVAFDLNQRPDDGVLDSERLNLIRANIQTSTRSIQQATNYVRIMTDDARRTGDEKAINDFYDQLTAVRNIRQTTHSNFKEELSLLTGAKDARSPEEANALVALAAAHLSMQSAKLVMLGNSVAGEQLSNVANRLGDAVPTALFNAEINRLLISSAPDDVPVREFTFGNRMLEGEKLATVNGGELIADLQNFRSTQAVFDESISNSRFISAHMSSSEVRAPVQSNAMVVTAKSAWKEIKNFESEHSIYSDADPLMPSQMTHVDDKDVMFMRTSIQSYSKSIFKTSTYINAVAADAVRTGDARALNDMRVQLRAARQLQESTHSSLQTSLFLIQAAQQAKSSDEAKALMSVAVSRIADLSAKVYMNGDIQGGRKLADLAAKLATPMPLMDPQQDIMNQLMIGREIRSMNNSYELLANPHGSITTRSSVPVSQQSSADLLMRIQAETADPAVMYRQTQDAERQAALAENDTVRSFQRLLRIDSAFSKAPHYWSKYVGLPLQDVQADHPDLEQNTRNMFVSGSDHNKAIALGRSPYFGESQYDRLIGYTAANQQLTADLNHFLATSIRTGDMQTIHSFVKEVKEVMKPGQDPIQIAKHCLQKAAATSNPQEKQVWMAIGRAQLSRGLYKKPWLGQNSNTSAYILWGQLYNDLYVKDPNLILSLTDDKISFTPTAQQSQDEVFLSSLGSEERGPAGHLSDSVTSADLATTPSARQATANSSFRGWEHV